LRRWGVFSFQACHARAGGNPEMSCGKSWMPACAGMTVKIPRPFNYLMPRKIPLNQIRFFPNFCVGNFFIIFSFIKLKFLKIQQCTHNLLRTAYLNHLRALLGQLAKT
jgi:hypothetical protein